MPGFSRKFVSDSGEELEIDGSFRFEGRDNIEVTDYQVWRWKDRDDIDAPRMILTEAEDFRLYEELMEDESTWEYDGDVYE